MNLLCVVSNFNSIKVRLEPVKEIPRDHHDLFQFHKGTIRTPSLNFSIFQVFHFNSIKVRLEPTHLAFGAATALFQFHKGAIRTNLAATFFTCSEISIP